MYNLAYKVTGVDFPSLIEIQALLCDVLVVDALRVAGAAICADITLTVTSKNDIYDLSISVWAL